MFILQSNSEGGVKPLTHMQQEQSLWDHRQTPLSRTVYTRHATACAVSKLSSYKKIISVKEQSFAQTCSSVYITNQKYQRYGNNFNANKWKYKMYIPSYITPPKILLYLRV
jgi:hypothetical protein